MMPINNDIMVALISGLCVAIPSIIATSASNRKSYQLMTYQLQQLTDKTDRISQKVDGIWERLLKLEGRMDMAEGEIHDIKHDQKAGGDN